MNNKRFFSQAVTFLVVATLVIVAFISGNLQFWLLVGAFGITLVWILLSYTTPHKYRPKAVRAKRRMRRFLICAIRKNVKSSNVDGGAGSAESNSELLMRHANCRVTEHLKTVFPEATWEWDSNNTEHIIEKGGTGRIRLFNIAEFGYADVTFDNMARISCNFVKIVPLTALNANNRTIVQASKSTELVIDPAIWYNLQGKAVLEECIGNLNSYGYNKIIIKENGDVCMQKDDKEVVCVKLKNLPAKNYWSSLVDVFNNRNFKASIADDCIAVSW